MALILSGGGCGFGCSRHGTGIYRSDCAECRELSDLAHKRKQNDEALAVVQTPEWQKKYDDMFERMQEPGARERMQQAFDATPHELGEAARDFARHEREQAEREFNAKASNWYAGKWCSGCSYGSCCLGYPPLSEGFGQE